MLASLVIAFPCQAKPLKIVTTVAPITDMVQRLGGELIQITSLIPEGVNSHTYEPSPFDAKFLSKADIIFINGLGLEFSITKFANKVKRPTSKIVRLGDLVLSKEQRKFDASFPENLGKPNPHLWLNVEYTMRYVELIRDILIEHDAKNRDHYKVNANRYLNQLQQLDNTIAACIMSVPSRNRKLITYHDSFAYFGLRYDMIVIDAIQPADFQKPSAKDVAQLINQLRQKQAVAVFGSVEFPSKILEQIAREANVQFIEGLSDDVFPGEKGTLEHSYIGMMQRNLRIMIGGLEGDQTCI